MTTSPDAPLLRLRPLSAVQPRSVRWLKPGLIPLGALTLVAGVGGLGKSTWLAGVAAETSRGDLLEGTPADTILVSFEDAADVALRPRVEAAQGDLRRVHEVVFDGDDLEQVTLPRDLEELERAVGEIEARLVVVDPIVAGIDVALDTHKDQHVRSVLARLNRLAEQAACAVVLVGHLNKGPSTDAYLRVANSTAFYNASRSVILVTEDESDDDLRLVAQRKNNYARLSPVERHRIEEIVLPDTLDSVTGRPVVTARTCFVEFADDVDAADVLAPPRTAGKTERAQAFLTAALSDGDWHESAVLKEQAEEQQISERTLKRAAKELGVKTKRDESFHAKTLWRLYSGQVLSTEVGLSASAAQPSGIDGLSSPTRAKPLGEGPREESGPSEARLSDPERAARFDAMYPPRARS